MKKVGLLFGIEKSFPEAVIDKINEIGNGAVSAEAVQIGALRNNQTLNYDLIYDRLSHAVPFFNSFLKMAVLKGVTVLNNPFGVNNDDNFYHAVLAEELGIKSPRTAIMPSKELPDGTTNDTMRNLIYPLNWEEIFEYIGFPARIRPNLGHSSYNIYMVYNQNEFFSAYELTSRKSMVLQENIEYTEYYRCFTVGRKNVLIVNYDPVKPLHLRYSSELPSIDDNLRENLEEICIKISDALDCDFNSVEIAVANGEPYVVDMMNTTPYAERDHLPEEAFQWLVSKTAEVLVEYSINPRETVFMEFQVIEGAEENETLNEEKLITEEQPQKKTRKKSTKTVDLPKDDKTEPEPKKHGRKKKN